MVATLVVWVFYSTKILTLPAEYGYVGVILITAFTYTLLRLRFFLVVLTTLAGIAVYLPYAFTAKYIAPVSSVLAALYLISFGVLGSLAAYWMERFSRQLFLRQRDLDQERTRSDGLLLNILPQAVVEQLKNSSGERIAEAFDDVSVIFVDAVGSTQQAARSSPEEFADALDELFRWFDQLADRHGLEKIKTIGDAYMAVAGAPVPMADHADATVGMALEIVAGSRVVRWPSGDPIVVRGGIATGPVVAGVIGERKFAYDVWGDTVNLASRLQEAGEPGQVLVSQRTADVIHRYGCGPVQMVDIKGKGADTRASPHAPRVLRRCRTIRAAGVVVNPWLRRVAPILVALACCLGSACTSAAPDVARSSGPGKGTIVVGVSGSFAENQLVAEMYADVLEHAGYTVERQFDLRSREVSQSALESGQIDLKPEYLSSLLLFLDPSAAHSNDPGAVAAQDRGAARAERDLGADALAGAGPRTCSWRTPRPPSASG